MIKIAVISKMEENREMMTGLLSSQNDFNVSYTGSDSYDALKSATTLQLDIIIMDFQMNYIDGAGLAPILKRRSPSTALIVFGSLEEADQISKSFRAGISGCLLKETDMDKLISAVRIVSQGGCYVSASIVDKIFRRHADLDLFSAAETADTILPKLSPLERGIIEGIACGYSDGKIAEYLHISQGTVRNYMATVKRRTGLRNRTQIVLFALMFGWILSGKIEKYILEQL